MDNERSQCTDRGLLQSPDGKPLPYYFASAILADETPAWDDAEPATGAIEVFRDARKPSS